MDNNRQKDVLEQLEQEFEKTKRKASKPKTRRRRILKKQIWKLLTQHKKIFEAGIIGICVVFFIALLAKGYLENDKQDGVPAFLTVQEKEEWQTKEVSEGEIFIYVNTNLEVDQETQEVSLRLANPPYCVYPLKVSIEGKEAEGKPYFESSILKPGGSLERAELKNLPKDAGKYEAVIHYTFYDKDGKTVVGEHTVSADLIIKK